MYKSAAFLGWEWVIVPRKQFFFEFGSYSFCNNFSYKYVMKTTGLRLWKLVKGGKNYSREKTIGGNTLFKILSVMKLMIDKSLTVQKDLQKQS